MRSATEADVPALTLALMDYFSGDLGMKATLAGISEVCEEMLRQNAAGILHMDVAVEGEALAGFIAYQCDTPQSDWCEREGWGFIREIYVARPARGRGVGEMMLRQAERRLRSDHGVKQIYLTGAAGYDFWRRMGYRAARAVSSINREPIYEKELTR